MSITIIVFCCISINRFNYNYRFQFFQLYLNQLRYNLTDTEKNLNDHAPYACFVVNLKVKWHFLKVQLNLFYRFWFLHWFERHNIGKLQQNLQMCYLQNRRIVLWAKSTMRSNARWLLQKRKNEFVPFFIEVFPM